MATYSSNNKRIAKNTVLLYLRTFFVMVISIYTSRVVLDALGIEDYGVYQVVGGMVALFSIVTNNLSAAISRFITYELGGGNEERLNNVFSTSRVIQLFLALLVLILAETVGLWFLKTQMQIPEGRMDAAFWVLQCSAISFCFTLISIPYNACIVAHEHMKAFAYFSIFEAVVKLGLCFMLYFTSKDRLVIYSISMMLLSVVIRFVYNGYCRRHFAESRAQLSFHKNIFKEMFGFAGWSFLSSSTNILNSQGVNMLINVFFGVTFNAARGLANQVKGALTNFVSSFTTAINPQITKSYASGEIEEMHTLVCRGARFSFYLILIMALPIICETETILSLWLKEVPEKTVLFVRLSLINALLDGAGYTSYTANLATGKIRKYSIVLSLTTVAVFPLVWITFYWGGPVEMAYYIDIISQIFYHTARMFLTQENTGLRVRIFLKEVYLPIVKTTIVSIIPSLLIVYIMSQTFLRFFISIIIGIMFPIISSMYVGMSRQERSFILSRFFAFLKLK